MLAIRYAWRRPSRRVFALAVAILSLLLPAGSGAAQGESTGSKISRLEGEIAELKVMVGTLQSMVASQPGGALPQESAAPSPGIQSFGTQGDLGPRVSALETQIGALTNQLEQIGRQLTALESRLGGGAQTLVPVPQESVPQEITPPDRQGLAPSLPSNSSWAAADASDSSKARWFGPRPGAAEQASATNAESSPQLLTPPGASVGSIAGVEMPESLMAALPTGGTRELYEQGYGHLLQHHYTAAEASFSRLIESHPDDPLAGNAQYWLGETYYARGQYKRAADAFLKGYKTYKSSEKAPDTLLKLGMSLAELGQKDAACSTFGELGAKFPSAPDDIRDQAKTESRKTGC